MAVAIVRAWALVLVIAPAMVHASHPTHAPELQRLGRSARVTIVGSPVHVPAGGVLRLDGPVVVQGTLFAAAAGARIEASPGAFLVIDRSSRMDIRGTVYEPVVFTCANGASEPGCWSGLTVLGQATINHGVANSPATPRAAQGCRNAMWEGQPYGGCADDDSSGVLSYVRVQYATFGVQLRGVGSRTRVEFLQVHRSLGQGVEVIGGTAPLRHVALTTNAQFGLSWAGGWRGRAQFVVIQQDPSGFAGGILGRNGLQPLSDHDALPRSAPQLANVTMVTRGGPGNPYAGAPPRAIALERGTAGRLHNVMLVEPSRALDVDDAATCAQVFSGNLVMAGITIVFPGDITDPDTDAAPCVDETGDVRLLANANPTVVTDPAEGVRQLSGAIDLLLPDLRPMPGTRAFSAPGVPPPSGGFFEFAEYVGAVQPNAGRNDIPWYSGWTIGEVLPPPGLSTVRGVALGGGRGGLAGVQVRALPSGASTLTDGVGGFELAAVPAGPVELIVGDSPGCAAGSATLVAHVGVPVTAAVAAECSGPGGVAVSLSVGDLHVCGLGADAIPRCWGRNASGQIGDSSTTDRRLPTPVAGTGAGRAAVGAGGAHSCAVASDGTAACWGLNSSGQLGLGTAGAPRTTPATVAGVWVMTTGGVNHTCALKATGHAWCWGDNGAGQLGNGTLLSSRFPTPIQSDTRFAWLDAGDAHTCGLSVEGLLWCWGNNSFGQLGDSTTTSRTIPTRVRTTALYGRVAAGGLHTCAVDRVGTARCWGANPDGQLGDGTQVGRTAPVVVGDTNRRYVRITAGFRHSCSLTMVGVAECWGANTSGRLGDGTDATRLVPVPVAGAHDYRLIGAGASFTCGLTVSRTLRCWGSNLFGQLGDGMVSDRFVPGLVDGGALFGPPLP
jgi:alpha-tubulin suppressor-like RCC1 family protein